MMFAELTPYGIGIIISACASLLLFAVLMHRGRLRAFPVFAVLVAALGVIGARGYYILMQNLIGGHPLFSVISFRPYEHALCGAVIGVYLALTLGARLTHQRAGAVMDAAAPAGLVMIAAARCCEFWSDFGWGAAVEQAWLQRFPLAVMDMFEEWHLSVFFLEALFALIALAYVLRCSASKPGQRFSLALLWWAMPQVLSESLRVETIRWGFVRVQQLQCVVFALILLLFWAKRADLSVRKIGLSLAVFLLCVGVLVFVEFALDKLPSIPNPVLYAVMAAALGVMGTTVQRYVMKS